MFSGFLSFFLIELMWQANLTMSRQPVRSPVITESTELQLSFFFFFLVTSHKV
jgi:hypothetical protein